MLEPSREYKDFRAQDPERPLSKDEVYAFVDGVICTGVSQLLRRDFLGDSLPGDEFSRTENSPDGSQRMVLQAECREIINYAKLGNKEFVYGVRVMMQQREEELEEGIIDMMIERIDSLSSDVEDDEMPETQLTSEEPEPDSVEGRSAVAYVDPEEEEDDEPPEIHELAAWRVHTYDFFIYVSSADGMVISWQTASRYEMQMDPSMVEMEDFDPFASVGITELGEKNSVIESPQELDDEEEQASEPNLSVNDCLRCVGVFNGMGVATSELASGFWTDYVIEE